jgi:hypothetical protein
VIEQQSGQWKFLLPALLRGCPNQIKTIFISWPPVNHKIDLQDLELPSLTPHLLFIQHGSPVNQKFYLQELELLSLTPLWS